MGKAMVDNASDVKQVRKAKRSEAWLADRLANDMRTIVAMPEGRRVFFHLLSQCKVFESIMETNARIYYSSGRQDWGHFLIAEITKADPKAWIQMQIEAGEVELDNPPVTGTLISEPDDE